jgi:hypothetical protein
VPDPLPYHFNLQRVGAAEPFLTSDLEARPVPLLVMARDNDHGMLPWSEGPIHGGQLPLPHQRRMVAGPDQASSVNR